MPHAAIQLERNAFGQLVLIDAAGTAHPVTPVRSFPIAAPTYGPRWFDCFDADQIGHDLETGAALAYLSQPEIHPDVDRVIAVYPDGRAYGWHQLNDKTPERGVMD